MNYHVYFEYYVCCGFLHFDTNSLLYGCLPFRITCCLCNIIAVIIKKTTVKISTTGRTLNLTLSIRCDVLLFVNTGFSLYVAAQAHHKH